MDTKSGDRAQTAVAALSLAGEIIENNSVTDEYPYIVRAQEGMDSLREICC